MSLPVTSKDYPNFLVFPETTPKNPLQHPRSCYDSVESRCLYNNTLEQCIQSCKNSPFCSAGYFIKDDDKTTCVPLRTDLFPLYNPAYTWEKEEMKNVEITSFVDNKVFPFPPKDVSSVFFNDRFDLVNVETGLKLLTRDEGVAVNFSVTGSTVYLGSPYRSLSIESMMSQPRFGEPLAIVLDKTTLVLQTDINSNTVKWVPSLSSGYGNSELFILAPVSDPKDTHVSYNDTFYISSIYGPALVVDPVTNTLKVSPYGAERGIMEGYGATFQFVPKFDFYSCDGEKCAKVDVNDLDIKENTVAYKGKPVYRKEGCFSVCGTAWDSGKFEKTPSKKWVVIPVILILLLIIYYSRG